MILVLWYWISDEVVNLLLTPYEKHGISRKSVNVILPADRNPKFARSKKPYSRQHKDHEVCEEGDMSKMHSYQGLLIPIS